jgi:hypothetical protein
MIRTDGIGSIALLALVFALGYLLGRLRGNRT